MEGRGLDHALHRRDVLKLGVAGLFASQLFLLSRLARVPDRLSLAAAPPLPDIQFDIGNFIAPAFTVKGVLVRFGPVFTFFTPARLTRTPSTRDQAIFAEALGTIEAEFPFSPRGVFTFVAYGIPYFNRLPGGLHGRVVSHYLPQLASDPRRHVLEEAVPSPTDVSPQNPGITKQKFNVPVAIEHNDILFTFRSDSIRNLLEVQAWLRGSGILHDRHVESPDFEGLFQFQRTRVMFQQIGLPRKVAEASHLPFTKQINPQSPMWMGFADQQVDASGPAAIVTFVGSSSAKLTNAEPGSYFDNGSIQHLSHDILDLAHFYQLAHVDPDHPDGEPYTERVQYMFRSNELGTVHGLPSEGNADQFTDGGGPAFLNNRFQGANDAFLAAEDADRTFAPPPKGKQTQRATFTGTPRIGHISALQRSSRAKDGTPIHIRMDGTGFDDLDVPDGTRQPKLQFTAFVPSAEFFRAMRANAAAQDLQAQFKVDPDDNGIERFMTATRRQNFLAPPRRHRAFPLLEHTRGR